MTETPDGSTDAPILYRAGSCVVCGQGTDTGIATYGEAEWHIAFLQTLGVPTDEASEMHRALTDSPPDMVKTGAYQVVTRVCAQCFAKSPFHPRIAPVVILNGGTVPVIEPMR